MPSEIAPPAEPAVVTEPTTQTDELPKEPLKPNLEITGEMDAPTIEAFNNFLGIKGEQELTTETMEALGTFLRLGVPFGWTKRHVRILQRKIGMRWGGVTGQWYRGNSATFDPDTTRALQKFLASDGKPAYLRRV